MREPFGERAPRGPATGRQFAEGARGQRRDGLRGLRRLGAYACLQAAQVRPASNLASQFTGLGVQTPGSSPYAVSVGGTRLELRSDGSYLTESAWASPLQRQGGGGISASEPRPSWQQGPGVIQTALNPRGARQVPDVAGPSDPSSGFEVCRTQPLASAPTCSGTNGCTSAASPFWAASMLLSSSTPRLTRRSAGSLLRRPDPLRPGGEAPAGAGVPPDHARQQRFLRGNAGMELRHRPRQPRRLQPCSGLRQLPARSGLSQLPVLSRRVRLNRTVVAQTTPGDRLERPRSCAARKPRTSAPAT